MMLLPRNDVTGVPTSVRQGGLSLGLPGATVPQLADPVTPWKLVKFYYDVLRMRWGEDGLRWAPPLGSNGVVYLRAAKNILKKHGPTGATQVILEGISSADHPPSLQWIEHRSQQTEERQDTIF